MNEPKKKRRAPAMEPEQRRAMIVQNALPLFVEKGTGVTTAQIAEAAGIGEGTIFRAFDDKEELLEACLNETLRPEPALALIADINLDQPLSDRLTEAATVLRAHMRRFTRLVAAISGAGASRHSSTHDDSSAEPQTKPLDRNTIHDQIHTALAELFEPETDSLRIPPIQAASLFHVMLLAEARSSDTGFDSVTVEHLVDVLLHGALTSEKDAT